MKFDATGFQPELIEYMNEWSINETKEQKKLRADTSHLEMSIMQISPLQGQFLRIIISLTNAEKCLEIGTFCGYSALVMAQAMTGNGKLVTCDINPTWTPYAEKAWKESNVSHKIDFKLGDAIESLNHLLLMEKESYDIVFIDADKTNYCNYYSLAYQLLKKGGIMLIDNVFWDGKVADRDNNERQTLAIRALNEMIAQDERVMSCMIPIADGFQLICKL